MKFRKPSAKVMRRTLTGLAICLALGGIGLVAYPFATNLWAARIQSNLVKEFASPAAAQAFRSGNIAVGDPVTRIEIPKLDVDTMVVEGTSLSALRAGAGHYPETPLPGEMGNVAIAGHRTTYGRPFNRLDELEIGDKIILETPIGTHTYEVLAAPSVVLPTDWDLVVNDYPPGGSFLTLTTCHPEGAATHRIVVRAELVDSTDAVAKAVGS
mgnify:CR=1 FL=1